MPNLFLTPSVQVAAGDSGLGSGLDPDEVTPGTLGFIMTIVMVLAVVILMKSMSKRVRRARYREQVAEQGLSSYDQPAGGEPHEDGRSSDRTGGQSPTGADYPPK